MAPLPRHICWIDLETTSLDPATTTVLEAFWEVTDWALTPVASGHGITSMQYIIADQFVLDMHERSGLAAACRAEPKADSIVYAMRDLYGALGRIGEQVPLAGSGVAHFDRLVLAAQYPFIAKHLTYWSLDLGPIRRLAEGTGHGDLALPAGDIAHRAEADVRRAQAEFRQWVDVLARSLPEAQAIVRAKALHPSTGGAGMTGYGHGVDETAGRITPDDLDWLAEQALTDGPACPIVTFDSDPHPADHCVDNHGRPRVATPEGADE
jgi:oligoribonuclease (3'-5' exoribonuclease)